MKYWLPEKKKDTLQYYMKSQTEIIKMPGQLSQLDFEVHAVSQDVITRQPGWKKWITNIQVIRLLKPSLQF